MGFDYRIYGLEINSSKEISLLPQSATTGKDIAIYWTTDKKNTPFDSLKWERITNKGLENRRKLHVFTAETSEGIYYNLNYFTDTGILLFILNPAGDEIWIVSDENEPGHNIESILVGPALGAILRLRGVVCLHSSVINIDGKAVAFIGKKRAGKSTMAATFVKNGYNAVADDVAAIINENSYRVVPGYPKVRLRPQSLSAIHNGNAEDYQQVYTNRDSRYTDITNSFEAGPLPLGAIYVLNPMSGIGETPQIEPLDATQKMVEVMPHLFAGYILNEELKKKEFTFIASLIKQIPIRKINFEHNLDLLDTNCDEIVRDFRQLL
jgi:hypothetical protein